MNAIATLLILVAALSADVIVETAAEIGADVVLDENAGAIAALVPGQPKDIVDMAPQVTIVWTR